MISVAVNETAPAQKSDPPGPAKSPVPEVIVPLSICSTVVPVPLRPPACPTSLLAERALAAAALDADS